MNLRKKDTKLLQKMDAGWANMEMDKDGKNLFLLGSNTMQKMGTDSESLKPISYQAQKYRRSSLRALSPAVWYRKSTAA